MAGRRGVDDHDVVGLGARRTTLVLGELPDLPDRQQLTQARCRRGDVTGGAARTDQLDEAARRKLVAQILLEREARVDGQRPQSGRELALDPVGA